MILSWKSFPDMEEKDIFVAYGGNMKKAALAVALLAVSACAAPNYHGKQPDSPSVRDLISEAADRGIAATNITAMSVSTVPLVNRVGPDQLPDAGNGPSSGGHDTAGVNYVPPPEAVQPVNAQWNGEVEGLLRHLAGRADYRLVTSGPQPAIPMTVAIVANEEPLRSVVHRVSAMTAGYARISMDEKAKTISIRYVR